MAFIGHYILTQDLEPAQSLLWIHKHSYLQIMCKEQLNNVFFFFLNQLVNLCKQ